MSVFKTSDKTVVEVSGSLDPRIPLVVLLHGVSGDQSHMTDPLSAEALKGAVFNRSAQVPFLRDAGFHMLPPLAPADGFSLDPPETTVRSWRQALNDAGFPTLVYSQVQPRGALAANVAQLSLIATEVLSEARELAGLRLVFLAHSRGGILLRQFLVGAAANGDFIRRVVAAITLHSPHQGSGLANAAFTIDTLVAQIQRIFAAMGIPPPGFLEWLRGEVGSPAYPEIAVGSPALAALAAAEPVPGIEWHTFGGTSTWFTRLHAHLYTPDSGILIPAPLPLFHWTTAAMQIGVPLDPASFGLPPIPIVAELLVALSALAATTPELRHGAGDLLTAGARAHLPFSSTRTLNPLNHAEALYSPALQAQVLAILERFRTRAPRPDASSYERLGTNPIASGPGACSWAPGRLDVFVRGTDDTLYHKTFDGGWSDYEQLGTNRITSDPVAVSWANGRIDVFVRGTDGTLYHKWFEGVWSDYEQLGTERIISGPGACSWAPGRLDVFVRGTDDALYHKWFDGTWSNYERLGANRIASDPVAVSWAAGRIDVFARGTDGALYHKWFDGAWSDYERLGTNAISSGPGVSSWAPGRLDVFVRGTDDALYHKQFDGSWSDYERLGANSITSDPDAVSWDNGHIDVFVRGTDAALYHKWFDGVWHP